MGDKRTIINTEESSEIIEVPKGITLAKNDTADELSISPEMLESGYQDAKLAKDRKEAASRAEIIRVGGPAAQGQLVRIPPEGQILVGYLVHDNGEPNLAHPLYSGEAIDKQDPVATLTIDQWPTYMELDLELKLLKTKNKNPLTKTDVSKLKKIEKFINETMDILEEYDLRVQHRLNRQKEGGLQTQTVFSQDVNE